MRSLRLYTCSLFCFTAYILLLVILISSLLICDSQRKWYLRESGEILEPFMVRTSYGSKDERVAMELSAVGDKDTFRSTKQTFPPSHSAKPPSTVKRRSLFIFGHDRSGTTFISNMFAQDPQMFMIYEPLWITRNMRHFQPGKHLDSCEVDVVNAILSCSFTKTSAATMFLAHTRGPWTGALPVNIFTSHHFCNITAQGQKRCPNLSLKPELVDRVCATEFKHSVVKVSPERVPDRKLSVFVPEILVENPEHDIRIVHIVRDPRGNIHSRINIKWMHEYPDPRLASGAKEVCDTITTNLKHVERMKTWLGERYTTVRYKDIADNPVETARKIYTFAGFNMPENLKDWIVRVTQPNKKMLIRTSDRPYSPVRNATGNADRWRKESPVGRVRVIEQNCGPLLDFLGLERVTNATTNGSLT